MPPDSCVDPIETLGKSSEINDDVFPPSEIWVGQRSSPKATLKWPSDCCIRPAPGPRYLRQICSTRRSARGGPGRADWGLEQMLSVALVRWRGIRFVGNGGKHDGHGDGGEASSEHGEDEGVVAR